MEERIFKLSLDKAKQWYNGSSQDLKRIALEVYTEEELTQKELPNSWKEYCEHYNFSESYHLGCREFSFVPYKYDVLSKLEHLRDCYRQGWEPDWKDDNIKYCIHSFYNKVEVCISYNSARFLSFQSPKIRDKFLENFRDLIEEAEDLI